MSESPGAFISERIDELTESLRLKALPLYEANDLEAGRAQVKQILDGTLRELFRAFGLDSIGFQAMGEAASIAKRFVITTVGDLKGAHELFDGQDWAFGDFSVTAEEEREGRASPGKPDPEPASLPLRAPIEAVASHPAELDQIILACEDVAAKPGYEPQIECYKFTSVTEIEYTGKDDRFFDLELPELAAVWEKWDRHSADRHVEYDFIKLVLSVAGHYLARNHPLTFGQMAARLVDLRSDNLDGAMRYGCGTLAILHAAGHDHGPAVAGIRRAAARALDDHGREQESSLWTKAAEVAEGKP